MLLLGFNYSRSREDIGKVEEDMRYGGGLVVQVYEAGVGQLWSAAPMSLLQQS